MSLDEKLSQLRTLLAQRDQIDQQLEAIIGHYGAKPVAVKQKPAKVAKTKRGQRGSGEIDSQVMQEASRRHPASEEIERMLIGGASVAQVLEKIEVSSPTVYVIKARLKAEGRLA